MDEKIDNIIPTLMGAVESDVESESRELLSYYMRCNRQEKAIVSNIFCMYAVGLSQQLKKVIRSMKAAIRS